MRDVDLPEDFKKKGTYQLTADTVSPTRLVGRDEDGGDVEETISCYPHREMFVDRAGNLCDVVLCNSRTRAYNNEAKTYAEQIRQDWIRAGGLPISECPHARSTEYKRLIGGTGALVAAPKDVTPCEGAPEGCTHLHAVREKRLAAQKTKTAKAEAQNATLNSTQLEALGATFGAQIASALSGDTKAHLRTRPRGPAADKEE